MTKEQLHEEVEADTIRFRAVAAAFNRGLTIKNAAYLLGMSRYKVAHIYRAMKILKGLTL